MVENSRRVVSLLTAVKAGKEEDAGRRRSRLEHIGCPVEELDSSRSPASGWIVVSRFGERKAIQIAATVAAACKATGQFVAPLISKDEVR